MSATELSELYEKDVYAWALKNAALLRQRRFDEIDVDHIAEEIESVGKSERQALESHLIVLLSHLLKWQYQPERRSRSWELTIREQRRRVERVFGKNPGLKAVLDETLDEAYDTARLVASRETGLSDALFPEVCPWGFGDILNSDFWPD